MHKIISWVSDLTVVNLPNALTFGVITLTDLKEVMQLLLAVVSIICSIILTRHKTKKRQTKNDDE